MNSKEDFFKVIQNYFESVVGNEISADLIYGLSQKVTDYYFDQYKRFYDQYPKSRKRYSSFQLKDIEHPDTYEIAIKYFKEITPANYLKYVGLIFQKSESEISEIEKRRDDFYKMF